MTNYYGCLSKAHSEFTCLDHSVKTKRFPREKWCAVCQVKW